MSTFGTVTSYDTGEPVRPATAAEWRRTADKVSGRDGDAYTGAWTDEDGAAVWVDGGPESRVSTKDIVDLRIEAAAVGDAAQQDLCVTALGDWDDDKQEAARLECVRVILDARMRAAEDADVDAEV